MKYPNIEAERARNGMSSENLAAALGVSRKTLYNWCATGNIPQSALFQLEVRDNVLKPEATSGLANLQVDIDFATEIVGISL